MKQLFFVAILLSLFPVFTQAQDDLEGLFDEENKPAEYTTATFKAPRIILGQSNEQAPKGNLIMDIQHQFGQFKGGFSEFFGLDQATTRIGFTYGLTDCIQIGLGRTAYQKIVDGSVKIKLLRQQKGKKNIPLALSYYGNMGVDGLDYSTLPFDFKPTHRLSYANQLLIARKFSNKLSLQLGAIHTHRNLVEFNTDANDVFSLSTGGRFKLNQRLSINAEYFYVLNAPTAADYTHALNVGLDIETGGHVFQLFFSNATGMLEQQFVAQSIDRWDKGEFHFGFNITRNFVIQKPKEFRD